MFKKGFIFLFILTTLHTFASPVYEVDQRILHEIGRSYAYEELSSPPSGSLFLPLDSHKEYLDTSRHLNFWIKIRVKINKEGTDLAFRTVGLWVDRLDMYQTDASGHLYKQEAGMFLHRGITGLSSGPHLIFRIPYSAEEKTYYFHYTRCEARPWEAFTIGTYNDVIQENIRYHAVSWFILSAFIIVLLQALTFFINTKEKLYLFYAFHVFFVTIYALLDFNLLIRMIGHRLNYMTYLNLYTISFVGSIFSLMFYTRSFFNTRKELPAFDKIILILVFTRLSTYLFSSILGKYHWYIFFNVTYWDLPLVVFALIIGIYALAKKKRYAWIFSMSFMLLILSIVLPYFFPKSSFQINLPYLSMIYLETLLFFFAITYRFKIINREKEAALVNTIDLKDKLIRQLEEYDRLKDKVNIELEMKVQERTEEISMQAEHIEEINELLKKHNIELKSDVESLEKARIFQEFMAFDEFSKTYPDDASCYAFLEKLKWGKGYACKKCQNTKFSIHDEMQRRKCSRCGYVESPTSDTFFHNIKFPLHKAFYLLYLFSSGKNPSFDELSRTLNLRTATIWSFRKKADVRIKETKSFKKSREGWITLIKN